MSNYTKATNFATKDTLPTGNSGKIVKGTEIDDEFNAIASAISSKADTASPTFTGTPAAPTATTGSNTTQIATTAYVKGEIDNLSLGNMSTQAKSAVDITGGTIVGITDLAVADGGTGVSTLTANAVLLGNGTSAVQTVAPGTSGNLLTSNGTTWTSAAAPTPFAWNVTYVDVDKAEGESYSVPSNCIGIYVWATVNGSGNNGGIARAQVKNSGGTTVGTIYVSGTNIGGGADGGSGMNDGSGTFIPLSSAASTVYFDCISNDVSASFKVQAYVTKA